jgi:hypothetical protein
VNTCQIVVDDEVVLEQGFLRVPSVFPLLIIIPPLLHTHPSPPSELCVIALTTQHIIISSVFKLGASLMTVGWLHCKEAGLLDDKTK